MKSTLMYVAMAGLIALQFVGFAMDGFELTRVVIILLSVVVMSQQWVIDSKERMEEPHTFIDQ